MVARPGQAPRDGPGCMRLVGLDVGWSSSTAPDTRPALSQVAENLLTEIRH